MPLGHICHLVDRTESKAVVGRNGMVVPPPTAHSAAPRTDCADSCITSQLEIKRAQVIDANNQKHEKQTKTKSVKEPRTITATLAELINTSLAYKYVAESPTVPMLDWHAGMLPATSSCCPPGLSPIELPAQLPGLPLLMCLPLHTPAAFPSPRRLAPPIPG